MPSLLPANKVFALLDDAGTAADPQSRPSRLYTGLQRTLVAGDGMTPDQLFAALEAALAQGCHAVGLFDYELGHALQRLGLSRPAPRTLVTVLLFEECRRMSAAEVEAWLAAQAGAAAHGVSGLTPLLDEPGFDAAVDAIHRTIAAGDTYQVNLTFPLRFDVHGDPVALYVALRARQPVPYGALLRLPDETMVLSLSPELFVSHLGGRLTCRPMKGTASATGAADIDERRAQALRASEKERSENLMIVDLLRNDLGRIARTGSVRVPALFSVERFGSVLQMTSTIEAEAVPGLGLRQVFDALYPCGSITGAPKRRTMQIIDELERWPRRLYTGGIGWFEPPAAPGCLGDFTLSVPIRTLLLDAPDGNDRRSAEMSVGAGIVYDSDARTEYQECLLKARFLTGIAPGFELFETLHATREGVRHLERHLERLARSAAQLGFGYDAAQVRQRLQAACDALPAAQPARLRLALAAGGDIGVTAAPLAPLVPLAAPVRVLLSDIAMPPGDPLLAHKTTLRRVYDEGWRHAESVGAFDTLFFNERGELTEGGRSNVFLRLGGRWHTPPLSCGVLPGVMRAVLLDDPAWCATERALTRDDLRAAEAICVCNALRGALAAAIDWPD
ncbi:MAG: chorismate-binding protein [Burkholderiaceae bacterium]|nr:chorismate-binding protein [Burkholderiaceae bacterium]